MQGFYILAFLSISYAGRAPYLGGDLQELIEETKRSGVTNIPRVQRPATAQQKQDYRRFNTKFTEIAKAYAEGYKAAIKAVQARALIAQKYILQNKYASNPLTARSYIPEAPIIRKLAENDGSSEAFKSPVPNAVTVTGSEKSGIPHPIIPDDHKIVQRSASWSPENGKKYPAFSSVPVEQMSEEKRNQISRMNFAALHRNAYFDAATSSGGILSRQNILFNKKEKRRRRRSTSGKPKRRRRRSTSGKSKHHKRERRSHMPYLGQNLDALGIIRAKPNWEKPKKKQSITSYNIPPPQAQQMPIQQYFALNRGAYFKQPEPQQLSTSSQDIQAAFRSNIPPYNAQQQQFRSNVPSYNVPQYNNVYNQVPMSYSAQPYAGFMPELIPTQSATVNTEDVAPGVQRKKKEASPEFDIAALNYAARHRNVYIDGVSGDPYSGGSSVLSRQNIIFKKH